MKYLVRDLCIEKLIRPQSLSEGILKTEWVIEILIKILVFYNC
jgi:hypothetical protein